MTIENLKSFSALGVHMDQDSREYFEHRERCERAAAKNATCPHARRVHQELAQGYAALIRRGSGETTFAGVRSSLGIGYPALRQLTR